MDSETLFISLIILVANPLASEELPESNAFFDSNNLSLVLIEKLSSTSWIAFSASIIASLASIVVASKLSRCPETEDAILIASIGFSDSSASFAESIIFFIESNWIC